MPKIPYSDRCEHCGFWSGDAEKPFRIYSKDRAKWLENATKLLWQKPSKRSPKQFDDWVKEGHRLDDAGE